MGVTKLEKGLIMIVNKCLLTWECIITNGAKL